MVQSAAAPFLTLYPCQTYDGSDDGNTLFSHPDLLRTHPGLQPGAVTDVNGHHDRLDHRLDGIATPFLCSQLVPFLKWDHCSNTHRICHHSPEAPVDQ